MAKKYKTLDEWLEELAKRESSGNYSVVNPSGYMGKYQMGEAALIDSGYYKKKGNTNNDWSGIFTGKDGVYSKEDFLNKTQAQENAIREYMKKQWGYLKSENSDKYIGTIINGINITPSGLLSGAHLTGFKKAGEYLRSNGNYIPKDGNGVSIEEYIRKFGDYDISEIITPNYYSPKFPQTKNEVLDKRLNHTDDLITGTVNQVMGNPLEQVPDKVINEAPIQAPLSEEEWRKRLRRMRKGIY